MEWLSQRCPLLPAAQGCPRPGRGTLLLVVILSLLMYPVLRSLALQLHSAVTGSYVSGTHSIAFINCLNEQIAKDIARKMGTGLTAGRVLAPCEAQVPCAAPGQEQHPTSTGRDSGECPRALPGGPELKQLQLEVTFASAFSGAIMDKKLAAYVNILPKSSALYFWKGELEESTEILLLVKTRTSKIDELSNYVRSIHPFEIPEIISLPIDQGNPLYLKWIEESVPRD
ncbi:protein CutA isoform X1 [Strix uralensis]|uniref:protein CutA isoform X1 n=2 Tax=Strix uralensis TaxID=36305 RepID=UPI003DA6E56B